MSAVACSAATVLGKTWVGNTNLLCGLIAALPGGIAIAANGPVGVSDVAWPTVSDVAAAATIVGESSGISGFAKALDERTPAANGPAAGSGRERNPPGVEAANGSVGRAATGGGKVGIIAGRPGRTAELTGGTLRSPEN